MFKKKKIKEQTEKTENSKTGDSISSTLKGVIDGTILTRDAVVAQLPFVLFLTLLALLYIGNRYQAERIVRETAKIQSELEDLRNEAISTTSELMFISKQSEVQRLISEKKLGLKEMTTPPYKIVVKQRSQQ